MINQWHGWIPCSTPQGWWREFPQSKLSLGGKGHSRSWHPLRTPAWTCWSWGGCWRPVQSPFKSKKYSWSSRRAPCFPLSDSPRCWLSSHCSPLVCSTAWWCRFPWTSCWCSTGSCDWTALRPPQRIELTCYAQMKTRSSWSPVFRYSQQDLRSDRPCWSFPSPAGTSSRVLGIGLPCHSGTIRETWFVLAGRRFPCLGCRGKRSARLSAW